MSKHREIADLLMPEFKEFSEDLTDKEQYRLVYKLLFLNFRMKHGEPYGLYLTHMGFEFLSKHAKSYDVTMPDGYKINMTDKLSLDNMCILPYYYESKEHVTLYMFEEELATIMKLNDGNIIQAQEMLYGQKKFLK